MFLRVAAGLLLESCRGVGDHDLGMRILRVLSIAAPLCLAGYGVVRLIGRAGGHYGPGWSWEVAHLLALAGIVAFGPVVVGLGRALPRRPQSTAIAAVTLLGLVAMAVQFGADILNGLLADDPAELKARAHEFSQPQWVSLAFYSVGPQLFFVGLVGLTVLLAANRRAPWWSPVLVTVSVLLPLVTLNLLPVAGLGLLIGLLAVELRAPAPARIGVRPQ